MDRRRRYVVHEVAAGRLSRRRRGGVAVALLSAGRRAAGARGRPRRAGARRASLRRPPLCQSAERRRGMRRCISCSRA